MYTTLDKLKFNFMPEKLRPKGYGDEVEDDFLLDIQNLYSNCYFRIFGERPGDNISKHRGVNNTLRKSSNACGCSIELFILTNMMAHKTANPDRKFYSNQLLGDFAIKRVNLYKDASIDSFGHFGFATMKLITEERVEEDDVKNSLLRSEVLAGSYILGYKLTNAGSALKAMYKEHELDFHPLWLAIEPSYAKIMNKHINRDVDVFNRHRSNVVQELRVLKKKKDLARQAFALREEIAPRAVEEVLMRRGFQANLFEFKKDCVVDMLKLWHKVSFAIQHYYCTLYVRSKKGYYYNKYNSITKRGGKQRKI